MDDLRNPDIRLVHDFLDLAADDEAVCDQCREWEPGPFVLTGYKQGGFPWSEFACEFHAKRFSKRHGVKMPPKSCRET
jgi:hypothetical protein